MTGSRSEAFRSTRSLLESLRAAFLEGQLTQQQLVVEVCRHACGLLQSDAVSVWLLKRQGAGRQLLRLGGFAAAAGALLDPKTLDGDDVTGYLAALQGGAFASGGEPGEARNLLHAAIGVNGSILGVLCCERHGVDRPLYLSILGPVQAARMPQGQV